MIIYYLVDQIVNIIFVVLMFVILFVLNVVVIIKHIELLMVNFLRYYYFDIDLFHCFCVKMMFLRKRLIVLNHFH